MDAKNPPGERPLFKKATYLLLTVLAITFIASALFGESGILVNFRVKREYDRLLQERDRLKQENERLAQEIRSLKNDPRRIEEVGRGAYGFGRPGEVVFVFPSDAQDPISSYVAPGEPPSPATPKAKDDETGSLQPKTEAPSPSAQ